MSLVDRKAAPQLSLPMSLDAAMSIGRSVWLLSASKSDADALRRRSVGSSVRPFLLLDLDTGSAVVHPGDILLLKTADRAGLDVLIDRDIALSMGAKGLAGRIVASLRKVAGGSVDRRSLDLGLVKFGSNTLRSDRKGWARNEIESTIDVLLVREMADSPVLTNRLCVELLDETELGPVSPLRPIALRLRADAVTSSGDQAAATHLYLAAAIGFAEMGMDFQSYNSRRLGSTLAHKAQQLDLWPEIGLNTPPRASRIGFHMRRFSGMKLPLAASGLPGVPGEVGLLRHVAVGAVSLEPSMIASWLAKDSSPSAEVSMSVAKSLSLNGMRQVDFVVDSELATLSGLAGRPPPGRREAYRFIAQSSSCSINPGFADTSFGRPASFLVGVPDQGRHVIRLQVLTRAAPPASIEFVLPPL